MVSRFPRHVADRVINGPRFRAGIRSGIIMRDAESVNPIPVSHIAKRDRFSGIPSVEKFAFQGFEFHHSGFHFL